MSFSRHRSLLRGSQTVRQNRLRTDCAMEVLEERRMLTGTVVNETLAGARDFNYVATSGNGNYVVVWAGNGVSGGHGLFMRLYEANGDEITNGEYRVSSNSSSLEWADVAMNSSGDFVVVWEGAGPDSGVGIWARQFHSDGTPNGTAIPVSYDATNVGYPAVAMDAAGDFIVTWFNDIEFVNGNPIGDTTAPYFDGAVYARHYSAGFDEGVSVAEDAFVIAEEAALKSAVAMTPNGDFVVAWTKGAEVNVQRYEASGSTVGSVNQVSTSGNGAAPDITIDADGDYVVTWVETGNVGHFKTSGGFTDTVDGTLTNSSDQRVSVAMDAYGDFALAWAVNVSGDTFVKFAGYAAGEETPEFDETLSTDENADLPSIVLTPTGARRLSWWEDNPSGGIINPNNIKVEVYGGGDFPNGQTSTVGGRHIFYNQSSFDGNSAAINATNDNAAIATDKSAYIPGAGVAVFGNITSFHRGINGIMVDLSSGGAHAGITASDFVFKVGNNNSPSSWSAAPAPSAISVIAGGGVGGLDRVEITWANGAISNEWLEVQVLATAYTGLAATDVHFWGNKIADSGHGNGTTVFETSSTDASGVFSNGGTGKPITDEWDYNRDGDVNSTDAALVFANGGNILRINIGSGGPFAPDGAPMNAADDGGLAEVAAALASRAGGMATAAVTASPVSVTPAAKQAVETRERATATAADDWRSEVLFAASEALDEILFELDDELLEPVLA